MLNKLINYLYGKKEDRRLAKALFKPYFTFFLTTIILFVLCQFDLGVLTKECGGGIMLAFLVHSSIMMFAAGGIRYGKD